MLVKTKSASLTTFSNPPILISLVLLCAMAFPAHATTLLVTNTNDSGSGSLRQALADANDGDTIRFAVTGAIQLTSGELVIDKSITIGGPGPDSLAVSRTSNTQFRIFHVMPGQTVSIQGLTISGGAVQFDYGGGILNDQATLTLTNCSVVGNAAYYGGGGVYNDGRNGSAALTIVNSAINDNSASSDCDAYGGGIANDSSVELTILNSTISGNSAVGQLPCSPGEGGGIAGGGTITNSTINGNHAGWLGGGIAGGGTITNSTISNNGAGGGKNNIPGAGGGINGGGTITNCTISGNAVFGSPAKGSGLGGGIYAAGTVTINNSTFSGNYILTYGNGGGICNRGTLEIGNTVLNRPGGKLGENIFNNGGTITSAGYNVSNDDGGGYLNGPGDQINTDPLLGPLQNNGGPTFTHRLLPGSPAIDAGDPNFTPPPFYDQRGPGYVRVFNGRIDIGSFETQPTPTPTPMPTSTPTPRPSPTPRSRPTPLPRPSSAPPP